MYQDNRGLERTLISVDGLPTLFFWNRSTHGVSYADVTLPAGETHPSVSLPGSSRARFDGAEPNRSLL